MAAAENLLALTIAWWLAKGLVEPDRDPTHWRLKGSVMAVTTDEPKGM